MQRYFSNNKVDNGFILNDDDWYHIRKVMRMNDGDKVEVVYESKLYMLLQGGSKSVTFTF